MNPRTTPSPTPARCTPEVRSDRNPGCPLRRLTLLRNPGVIVEEIGKRKS